MIEKYGFVYIWFDKKHKRYYIGCRWGNVDDGYICSSNWMRDAYKRRPQDFKRRTLAIVKTNRRELLLEEHKWLQMIKKEELGKRYYNLIKHLWIKKTDIVSLETKQKISKSTSIAMIQYYKDNPRTEETCRKIGENSKRLQAEKKIGMHGKTHKEDTIQLMKDNNAMNNPEHRAKVKKAKQNIKWLINKNKDKKMAVPGTDKWNNLIAIGYMPIRKTINVNL